MNLPIIKPFHSKYDSNLSLTTNYGADLAVIFIDESDLDNKKIISPTLKALDDTFGGTLSALISMGDFEGKWLQTSVTLAAQQNNAKRVLLVGSGKKCDFAPARARQLGIKAAEMSLALKAQNVVLACNSKLIGGAEQLAQTRIGFSMGLYKYPNSNMSQEDKVKCETPINATFIHAASANSEQNKKAEILNNSMNICRLLQDGPPNIVTPKYVAENILEEAKKCGLNVQVFGAQKLREMGFGAMMAVAGGSAQEAQLVVVEYKPEKFTKTLAFVGKGLTMDTGGYSIKTPSTNQEGMKYDMSGAAVSLSSILAIAKLKLPIHVYAVGALCENMIDAHSYRVGDILTSYSGKTIEIIDTDAEGRIVLSDALHYAAKDLKADYIVEYSTLTGAMIIALGHVAAGVFAFNSTLEKAVLKASETTGERTHSLPVWEEVADEMKGTISDLVNIGSTRRAAGSMAAAAFLKEFVNDVPFAHIDIAGVADNNKSIGYTQKGGSGYGIQLSVEIAQELAST
ncbi:MAG: leucyl aminopeptidase family protein [Bdellovibrionota bacterium]